MRILSLWQLALSAIALIKLQPIRATVENDLKIIKQKLVDIDAKMNLISNINLQQINDKINQINNKLEQKNNDYNKISNMMQNHYKPFDTSLIIDRIKVLEDGLKSLTSKLDSLNNVEAKINNLKSDINEININSRLLKSQLLPGLIGVEKTEFLTQIDALGYQLNAMNQVQNDIKAKLESCTNIHTRTNTLNKSIPNSDSKQTMPKPPLELISPSSSMETVLYQFLETANIAADDSLSPQSVVNDDKNDKRRSRPQGINNNNRQSQTFGLLKQLWKKFTRPIYNLSRSFEDLKKNGLKDSGLCEKSVTQFNKLQTMIVSHFDTLSQSFRPSFNFCENIMKKLESLSINSDAQFNNLDQRMFYHISLSEKMYDKLSNSVFLTNEASVDKSFSDVKASDCAELQELGADINGIHTIYINNREKEVYCDFTSHGGGWTVIQRRDYYPNQQENFNRKWEDYKQGFGKPNQEFWFGNDDLNWMTTSKEFILLVELKDFSGSYAFAFYNTFRVDAEETFYRLSVGDYNGNASDSLAAHNGKLFSTFDKINDEVDPCCSCALTFEGGWWFYACFESHLNGPYMKNPTDNGYFRGIIWEHWKGDYSLKACEMKIRPKHSQMIPTTRNIPANEDDSDYSYPDP